MQPIVQIFAGIVLLLFGRRLFWLFVGLLGFFGGFSLAARYFAEQPAWITLLIAAGCGLIGILVALFLQRVAIAIAGFLAGGMFATNVLKITGWQLDPTIAYILIGIVGAILLSVLFEWALIFFTSLTGAMLITRSITLQPSIETGLIILLVVLGIVIQSRIRPSRRVVTKET
jgi:hypothetical protein